MSESNPSGRFIWFDLMTSDPEAAVPFYSTVVGWGTQPWEGGETLYEMWTNQGTPLGGIMELPEDAKAGGAPPHWLAYVSVPDAATTAAKAEQLGGTLVHGPQQVAGAGSFAVLADPQGAVFAVYASAEETPTEEGPPKVGEFSWHELGTSDFEAAFTFYSELFGWERMEAMDMGEGSIYQMYGQGGREFGGIYTKPPEMPGPPAWLYYVSVPDVHEAVKKVEELGGKVLIGPMEVPGGDWVAQCMDPQGAAFALHSSEQHSKD